MRFLLPLRCFLRLWAALNVFSCGQSTAVLDDRVATERKLERLEPQEAYGETLHGLLRTQVCIACHKQGGMGSGAFADEDVAVAFAAAREMMLFNTSEVEASRVIRKLKTLHNCGDATECGALIEKVATQVRAFSRAVVRDDFEASGLKTSSWRWSELPVSNPSAPIPMKTLMLSLVPPLPDRGVAPRFELTLRRDRQLPDKGEEVWSFYEPRIHIDGHANVRVRNVTILLNGKEAANTLQTIDVLVVGPTKAKPEILTTAGSSAGVLTLKPEDSVQLAFDVLEFAR